MVHIGDRGGRHRWIPGGKAGRALFGALRRRLGLWRTRGLAPGPRVTAAGNGTGPCWHRARTWLPPEPTMPPTAHRPGLPCKIGFFEPAEQGQALGAPWVLASICWWALCASWASRKRESARAPSPRTSSALSALSFSSSCCRATSAAWDRSALLAAAVLSSRSRESAAWADFRARCSACHWTLTSPSCPSRASRSSPACRKLQEGNKMHMRAVKMGVIASVQLTLPPPPPPGSASGPPLPSSSVAATLPHRPCRARRRCDSQIGRPESIALGACLSIASLRCLLRLTTSSRTCLTSASRPAILRASCWESCIEQREKMESGLTRRGPHRSSSYQQRLADVSLSVNSK